jgi:predicted NBD/HSP70 family sugar kinase
MTTVHIGPEPVDYADVRATNLAVVLRHVSAAAPCSRAEIAAATGLNKATVSSLVAELIGRRVLRETGLSEHRVGRPSIMLAIEGSGYVGIGMDVGADDLTVVAVDLAGRRVLTWRRSFPVRDRSPGRAVAEVARLARRATERVRAGGGTVVGLTVAVPGLVDSAGVVRGAPVLGWADVDLRASLERALGQPDHPVTVDSGATLGAIAEHRYGAHAGTAHLAYLGGQPGGAVGLISGGVPVRGVNGFGGVLGHVRVDPAGSACACGRAGCLETVAGVPALLRLAGTEPPEPGALGVEVEQLARRAGVGEGQATAALAEVGSRLGYGVALLVNLLNPAVVLLGGHYAPLAPWLLPAVVRALRSLAVAPDAGGLQLAASTLGYEAVALGGAAVALQLAIDHRLRSTYPSRETIGENSRKLPLS